MAKQKEVRDDDYDSRPDTWKHINVVQGYLTEIVKRIIGRLLVHDQSKLEDPEKALFDEHTPKLSELEYGSEEYIKTLEELGPALDHHYAKNSHHPEHHENGISDMTLVDIIEMFCDWKAASDRQHDGNIRKSLKANKARFKISPQLHNIFENTVKELGWIFLICCTIMFI